MSESIIHRGGVAHSVGLACLSTLLAATLAAPAFAADNNAGGWEASALRANMNSGEIWNLLPSELQDSIASVDKLTANNSTSSSASVSSTSDKLFLLSYAEYVPTVYSSWSNYKWFSQEGSQYEFWAGKVTNNNGANTCLANLYKTADGKTPTGADLSYAWERSAFPFYSGHHFMRVTPNGAPSYSDNASIRYSVSPAWCF